MGTFDAMKEKVKGKMNQAKGDFNQERGQGLKGGMQKIKGKMQEGLADTELEANTNRTRKRDTI